MISDTSPSSRSIPVGEVSLEISPIMGSSLLMFFAIPWTFFQGSVLDGFWFGRSVLKCDTMVSRHLLAHVLGASVYKLPKLVLLDDKLL